MSEVMPSLRFKYRNHRGEVADRSVMPTRVWFGCTAWHPEPQWLMDALDCDKRQPRTFALRDILEFQ